MGMKKVALMLVTALLAVSCNTVFMVSNLRKLEIGMSKSQVTNVMGKDYSIVFADENITVWGYANPDPESLERYILTFEKDRLKQIETVLERRSPGWNHHHPDR